MGGETKSVKPRQARLIANKSRTADGKKVAAKKDASETPKVEVRSKTGGVCVGALSIAHDKHKRNGVRGIDLDQLVEIANAIGPVTADIILFCGVRLIDTPKDWEGPAKKAARTAGCSFLLESKENARHNAWWLITPDGGFDEVIRTGQYVVSSEDVWFQSHLVFAEFEEGYGRIDCTRKGERIASLALFICGEARMLSTTAARVFSKRVGTLEEKFFAAFEAEDNILLHPSHTPYRSQIARTGGNLVAPWRNQTKEPVLAVAVRGAPNGAHVRPFRAAVHAGPYFDASAFDCRVATIAFKRGSKGEAVTMTAKKPLQTTTAGGLEIQYAEFVV